MILKSTRSLEKLSEVLMNPYAQGPEIAYWVFSGVSKDKWENMTIISNGLYGGEFPKTYGHYHSINDLETYKLIFGEGVLQLQKKVVDNNGVVIPNKVDEVFLVRFGKDDEVSVIPDEYGHSWSNVGNTPLISFDDWRSEHSDHDYEIIRNQKGLCFYIVEENNEIKLVPNPNYVDHPKPKWVTPEEFNFYMSNGKK